MHHDISAAVVTDAFPDTRDKRAAENPSPTRRHLGKSRRSLFRKYRHGCMTDLREICFADDIPVFYPCGKADPDISSEPRTEAKRDKNFGFDFGPPTPVFDRYSCHTLTYIGNPSFPHRLSGCILKSRGDSKSDPNTRPAAENDSGRRGNAPPAISSHRSI